MRYNAIDLAKYIVNKCNNDDMPISNLQLQKIMYYIQKDFLNRTGCAAFNDLIESRQFGPVVPNVYYHFCGYGAMPITITYDGVSVEECDKSHIDRIIEEKRVIDTWDLVSETHEKKAHGRKHMNKYEKNFTTIPSDIGEAITKELKNSLKAVPIMICRLSNHPEDNYLFLYIAQANDESYIAGLANTSRGGSVMLGENHYGCSFKWAMEITTNKIRDLNKEEL